MHLHARTVLASASTRSYSSGEVEVCINSRTIADGANSGVDLAPIVRRLVGERQPNGGLTASARGSRESSCVTTTSVFEGLLENGRAAEPL